MSLTFTQQKKATSSLIPTAHQGHHDHQAAFQPPGTKEAPLQTGFGHDFGQVNVHSGGRTGQQFAWSCPLALASPRACPFGGACHSCPAPVQAKLTISQPGDKYEQEADRVADRVMSMPEPAGRLQRECSDCEDETQRQPKDEEEEEASAKLLQRQDAPPNLEEEEEPPTAAAKERPGQKPVVSLGVTADIQGLRSSGGQALSPATRAFMEPRFGHDFSRVRVHTDAKAADTAQSVQAKAFTVGRDIVFGGGQYASDSQGGRRLLAHELAHVVQQKNSNRLSRFTVEDCDPKTNPKQNPKTVENAHKLAMKMLGDAISKSGKASDPIVITAAKRYFKINLPAGTTADKENWAHVQQAIKTMKTADGDAQYECEPEATWYNGLCSYDGAVSLWNIHLCPGWFDFSLHHQAAYLLHEWGHKWGEGINRVFELYCYEDGYSSQTADDLIEMPDAYMSFIYELSTGISGLCI